MVNGKSIKGYNTTVSYKITPINDSEETIDNSKVVTSLPTIPRVLTNAICNAQKEILGIDSNGNEITDFTICVKTGNEPPGKECTEDLDHEGFSLKFDQIRNKCVPYSAKYKNICSYSNNANDTLKKKQRKLCPNDGTADINNLKEQNVLSCDNYVKYNTS